jgi:hypothetical protein
MSPLRAASMTAFNRSRAAAFGYLGFGFRYAG